MKRILTVGWMMVGWLAGNALADEDLAQVGITQDATALERYAAKELQCYFYQVSGMLLPIGVSPTGDFVLKQDMWTEWWPMSFHPFIESTAALSASSATPRFDDSKSK